MSKIGNSEVQVGDKSLKYDENELIQNDVDRTIQMLNLFGITSFNQQSYAAHDFFNRQKRARWEQCLKNQRSTLTKPEEPEGSWFVSQWDRVLDEYIDFLYVKEIAQTVHETVGPQNLSLEKIWDATSEKESEKNELSRRLVDVKLAYVQAWEASNFGHTGTFEIVGFNDLHKLSHHAVSCLTSLSKKVLYLSNLLEKLMNLHEFIEEGQSKDSKSAKTEKRLKSFAKSVEMSDESVNKISDFKNKFRTGEVHKLSSIRALTSKEKWEHFVEVEKIIEEALFQFAENTIGKSSS